MKRKQKTPHQQPEKRGDFVISVDGMLSRMNNPSCKIHEFPFSRDYGVLNPDEYNRVERQFLEIFDARENALGEIFTPMREMARELLRNAFKHGIKNTFGGVVSFTEYEDDTSYAFGFTNPKGVIPADVIQRLGDGSPPEAFAYTGDGLHGNCFRKLKDHLLYGLVAAVATTKDRRGIYLLIRKASGGTE